MVGTQAETTCEHCGSRVTANVGCMACLLDMGLDDAASSTDASKFSLEIANYRFDLREDGSRWELGRGTMGITYRATDTALNRRVALKIVAPEDRARGAARERFSREARIAAGLRHPNIATVYHFGVEEETNELFYAMELVEGETLEERVRRTGPLDARTTVAIAQQVVAALAAAEKSGLIHRDLKPANIMLVGGDSSAPVVKIIDFGLARALDAPCDPMTATQTGFVGTPAFASPEQFAHGALDVRSDIYSLGATLWFALTGKKPFRGATAEEIRKAQNAGKLPLEQLTAAHAPRRLRALLQQMLAREPAARPGVAALTASLQRCSIPVAKRAALVAAIVVVTAAGSWIVADHFSPKDSSGKSIAVLPFEELSPDARDWAVADSIHDDLLVRLSKITDLKVISRNSVMPYRGTSRDLREIGSALGVAAVLEGSVRHESDRARINVQLIRTTDGAQVWAENYECNSAEAFATENAIALQIASALKAHVSDLEAAHISQPLTSSREAYLRFIEAKNLYLDYRKPKPDLEKATHLLEEATTIDPRFAAAYGRLAQVENTYFEMYGRDPAHREKALAAAEKALQLQADLPEAHVALGLDYWRNNAATGEIDYEKALKEFAIAERGLPNDPEIATFIGRIERHQGKWAESTNHLRKAVALDPRSVERWHRLFFNYEATRNFPAAAQTIDRVLALAPPENRWTYLCQRAFLVLCWKGDITEMAKLPPLPAADADPAHWQQLYEAAIIQRDYDKAEATLHNKPLDTANDKFKDAMFGDIYFYRGETSKARDYYEKARPVLEKTLANDPRDTLTMKYLPAIYALLGRKEDAMRQALHRIEIFAASQDQWYLAGALEDLAATYVMAGDYQNAFSNLERSLAMAGGAYRNELRHDPAWDPIRKDARFQALLAQPDSVTPVNTAGVVTR
jgi:serine/threonine protein kinase/tetratricopeptide (TPR) repeat protein